MIKINISRKSEGRFHSESYKSVYDALNSNKTVLCDQKGAELYNFSTYSTNERKSEIIGGKYLLVDFEHQKNGNVQTSNGNFNQIKKYAFTYYSSFNNGLHIIFELKETYTEEYYKKNSKKIIELIKSGHIGVNLDEGQISPRRGLYMPHTRNSGMVIEKNTGDEKLTFILKKKPTEKIKSNVKIDELKSTLIQHANTGHDDKLYPLVQSLKNEGVDKTTAELFWMMMKHPESKSDFENKGSTENTPYTFEGLYKILGVNHPTSDLIALIERFNVYWDVFNNVASVNRDKNTGLPTKSNGDLLLLFLKTRTTKKIKISKIILGQTLTELKRDRLINMPELYKEHIIAHTPNDIIPEVIFKLFVNLCSNGNGDAELIQTKLNGLCRWFYVAVFGDSTHQLSAVNFYGAAGSGKSLFSEIFRTIYQTDNAVVGAETDSFNGIGVNAKLLLFEESTHKKTDMEKIKKQLFAPFVQINQKNIPIYQVPNNFIFQFNSNEVCGGISLYNDVGFSRRGSFFKVNRALLDYMTQAEIDEIVEVIKNKDKVAEFVGYIYKNYKQVEKLAPLHQDLKQITKLHETDLETILAEVYKDYNSLTYRTLKHIYSVFASSYQKNQNYKIVCASIFDKLKIGYQFDKGQYQVGIGKGGGFFNNENTNGLKLSSEAEVKALFDVE